MTAHLISTDHILQSQILFHLTLDFGAKEKSIKWFVPTSKNLLRHTGARSSSGGGATLDAVNGRRGKGRWRLESGTRSGTGLDLFEIGGPAGVD